MSKYTCEEVIEMAERGKSLEGTDLSRIDLSGVDFRSKEDGGPCEKSANFKKADLEDAKLNRINFTKSNMESANLKGAHIRHAYLWFTNLKLACLEKANLQEANVAQVNMEGANLVESILWHVDLDKSNLNSANLEKANLRGAYLRMACLRNARLVDADLWSSNLNNTDLRNANITGANIWGISHTDWKINGIICTHIYQCPDEESWEDSKEREKYRRDFKPGEFEAFYKTLPKIELIFQQGFTPQDLSLLTAIIEQINQRLPSPIDMNELKKGMSTTISLTAENNEILKTSIPMIQQMYQKLEEKNDQLLQLTNEKNKLEQRLSEMAEYNKSLIRKIPEPQQLIRKPDIYHDNRRFYYGSADGDHSVHQDNRTYSFTNPDEAENVALEIIEQLSSSENIEETFAQIDQVISLQLYETPEKKEWLKNAFMKYAQSLEGIIKTLTTLAIGASGSGLWEILQNIHF